MLVYDRAVRIMHLESGRHYFGGARQVGNLITGLAKVGVDNILVCTHEQPLARLGLPCEVRELPMLGDTDFALTGRLRHLIAEHKPDLLHVHSRRGADLFGGWASAKSHCPAVLTRRVDQRELKPWARFKYRPYAQLVAISGAVRAELCQHVGLPLERVKLIRSSVDTELFRPNAASRSLLQQRFDLPADVFVVGVVAQLISRKGHRSFLDLLPDVVARHPNVRVLLFGRGPLEQLIRQTVIQKQLGNYVKFCGFQPEIEQLLPGLDLLVHPAVTEGLGVAILEAMSAGVAVVASRVGGIVDVIDSGVDGITLQPGNASAWADSLEDLITDSGNRKKLAAAGRAKVMREFGIGAMTERYLEVYDNVSR